MTTGYLMDQTGVADMTSTGDGCLRTVQASFDVVPEGLEHAGKDACEALFAPRGGNNPEEQQAQDTMYCDFANTGIGRPLLGPY